MCGVALAAEEAALGVIVPSGVITTGGGACRVGIVGEVALGAQSAHAQEAVVETKNRVGLIAPCGFYLSVPVVGGAGGVRQRATGGTQCIRRIHPGLRKGGAER